MLKKLELTNFILIDKASIPFHKGFNVLSGETGSGKTMLMQALALLLGQKADTKHIRNSKEKAILSCAIDITTHKTLYETLKELGIEIEKEEELLITREFTAASKSRAFINNQQVSLAALKKISPYILEIVGAASQFELKDEKVQLLFLDLFAELKDELSSYRESFQEEKALEKELESITSSYEESKRLAPFWKSCIEEIESADLKEKEDEELFEIFSKLSHTQDIISYAKDAKEILEDSDTSILIQLNTLKSSFVKMQKADQTFDQILKKVETASELLSELSFFITSYVDKLDLDPSKVAELEKRLSLINSLKKRYANDVVEIIHHKEELLQKLYNFENFDECLQAKKKQLSNVTSLRVKRASSLTRKREQAALDLSLKLTEELKQLNMASSVFEIKVSDTTPNSFGSDAIEFFFSANAGESLKPLKMCASGGELSRVLLALKLILADKQKEKILIFDEIDANIGGETASLIAKKLQELGKKRQIFCITHFPQVAKEAHYHLKIQKKVIQNRTVTSIEPLSLKDKEEELIRMFGGEKDLFATSK
ncbi:MAG: DNA repair protein RecN [Chlamydiia bacterium]|nr:DNA repair protein RecN [Chlamydiia bacterium]